MMSDWVSMARENAIAVSTAAVTACTVPSQCLVSPTCASRPPVAGYPLRAR